MVKPVTAAILGCALVLGVFLHAPRAGAVSMKQLSLTIVPSGGTGMVSFFLGEDGGIWFTSTNPSINAAPGFGGDMTTGNRVNQFDFGGVFGGPGLDCAVRVTCNGFVEPSLLATGCGLARFTCAGIYAKTPGPGMFVDSPTVQVGRPIFPGQTNIVVTGADNNFWYTVFDSARLGTQTSMGVTSPGGDPFSAAGEQGNSLMGDVTGGTGFVDHTSLAMSCAARSRACVGIWVRFP